MKTVLITGATSGIGYAVCRAFAEQGWAVLGVGRSPETCAAAKQALENDCPGAQSHFLPCDLSKQAEVSRLGSEALQLLSDRYGGRLDVLINNAGCVRSYYTTTEDGMETVFAVNQLAAFQLTNLLLPALVKARGRMLITASQSHKYMKMRWDDLMFSGGYRPLLAYKQSKLANLLLARGCNLHCAARGVRSCAIDPGLVNTGIGEKNTAGIVKWFWHLRRGSGISPAEAARRYLFAAEADLANTLYIGRLKAKRYSRQVTDANAERLWALSMRLCGMDTAQEGDLS